ncbi:MAG: phosphoribosylformylglycinamidine synthase I [Methanolinea sp.]|jgi:phosphoribosylformylglycinamidine synthase|nr:phosphoribosylformylglycinamidine synthase I [Methanolinea sp.]
MRFAVVQFGGSNCDRDASYVLSEICGIDTDLVWYKDGLTREYDAVILPGGFSYGDYLRAGAIAARTPVMDDVRRLARDGRLVLGICNGAQILAESGLVTGIFTINAYPKFICRWTHLRVERADTPFTGLYTQGDVIRIPIAHQEGRYVPSPRAVGDPAGTGCVAFRFCNENGELSSESNPNGSYDHITGMLSPEGNVLAMMPHPERASESVLGSEDGRLIFLSMIRHIERETENGGDNRA